jgi:hypothetical protein
MNEYQHCEICEPEFQAALKAREHLKKLKNQPAPADQIAAADKAADLALDTYYAALDAHNSKGKK